MKQKPNRRARRIHAAAIALLCMCAGMDSSLGIDAASVLRKLAKVADDVPIAKLDDVATSKGSSRFARDLVEEAGARFDDVAERTKTLRRLLKESSDGLPPSLVKQLDSLEGPAQESLAVLAKGSKRIGNAVPDVAERGRLLADGGAQTLLAVGRYEDLADDAVRFSVAARARKLPKPSGGYLAADDFGSFFVTQGERGKKFWDNCVRKNWKLWLGSTALAAVIAAPDEYLDEAGNLLEGAVQKLARLGGRSLGIALAAAGTAVEIALWETFAAFVKRPWGLAAVVMGGLLAIGGIRGYLLGLWGMVTRGGTTQRTRRGKRPQK